MVVILSTCALRITEVVHSIHCTKCTYIHSTLIEFSTRNTATFRTLTAPVQSLYEKGLAMLVFHTQWSKIKTTNKLFSCTISVPALRRVICFGCLSPKRDSRFLSPVSPALVLFSGLWSVVVLCIAIVLYCIYYIDIYIALIVTTNRRTASSVTLTL